MGKPLNFLHLDMDAFYASVEERDNPSLKGKPVIVGGRSNRGIVTTCNYEARKFGVHSAMPIFMAKELCPNGIFISGRMSRYQEVSKQVFTILRGISSKIEPLSIDEAYMDISQIPLRPEQIRDLIKEKVYRKTGLTLSIGVSYNKFLAKLASDWNKPNGFMIITEEMMPDILFPLSIKKVYGIGAKSQKKLNAIGIYTIEDLYSLEEGLLVDLFGKGGVEIYERIRGIDRRQIETSRERKSIGVERTFRPTRDRKVLMNYLKDFSYELEMDLSKKDLHGKTLTVKIKDEDFISHTKSKTYNHYIYEGDEIYSLATALFQDIVYDKSLRLIGISLSNLLDKSMEQLSFFSSQKNG